MYDTMMVILTGLLFGFSLYWSGVSHRRRARSSIRMENLTIARILLYAVGYAMFLLAICRYAIGYDEANIAIKNMDFGVVVGGFIFGLGLGVIGNCSVVSLAALPYEHKCKTLGIILGGGLGYWLYQQTAFFWINLGIYDLWNYGKLTLYKMNGFIDYILPFGYEGVLFLGVLMMVVAILMPRHFRNKEKLAKHS
jgi:fatty acid desaturase